MWTAVLFVIIGATFVAIAWWVEGPRVRRLARSHRAVGAQAGRDYGGVSESRSAGWPRD